MWATDPGQTLRQAGLLVVVMAFLVSTYAYRWTKPGFLMADLAWVFWTGVCVHAVGVIGYLSGQPWAIGPYDRLIGLTPNANYPGISGAALVALSYSYPKLRYRFASLVPLLSIFLSDTRGTMVAVMLGLTVIILLVPSARNRRDRGWAIGTIVALPALFLLRWMNLLALLPARTTYDTPGGTNTTGGPVPPPVVEDVTSGRLDIYLEYINIWLRQPWLGIGYRSPQAEIGGKPFEAHNVYLSVLTELGVLGATVFVAFLLAMLLSSAPRVALLGAAGAVLTVELAESSLFGLAGPTALFSWLVLFGWAATGLDAASKPVATNETAALRGPLPGDSQSESVD